MTGPTPGAGCVTHLGVTTTELIARAVTEARNAATRRLINPAADGVQRERWWVLGDPQEGGLERVFAALAAQGLIQGDGRLKPDVAFGWAGVWLG